MPYTLTKRVRSRHGWCVTTVDNEMSPFWRNAISKASSLITTPASSKRSIGFGRKGQNSARLHGSRDTSRPDECLTGTFFICLRFVYVKLIRASNQKESIVAKPRLSERGKGSASGRGQRPNSVPSREKTNSITDATLRSFPVRPMPAINRAEC